MEMPKPTEHHVKLKALVGKWTGDEKMFPSPWDPKGGEAKGVAESKLDLDGMFVVTEYRQERDGKVTYRGHGVFGWDARKSAYTMYWFDSMGNDPGGPAIGTFEGNTLRFEMKSPMGFSRYEYTFEGEDKYAMTIAMSADGQSYQPWLESSWVRAS